MLRRSDCSYELLVLLSNNFNLEESIDPHERQMTARFAILKNVHFQMAVLSSINCRNLLVTLKHISGM